jgi:hypothetical protein
VGGKGVKEISMSQLGIDSISQQQVSIVAAAPSNREVGCRIGISANLLFGRNEDVKAGTTDRQMG